MTQNTSTKFRLKVLANMLPIIALITFYYTRYIEGTYSFAIPLLLTFFWLMHSMLLTNAKKVLFNRGTTWWLVYFMVCIIMTLIGRSSTNFNFVISNIPIYLIPAMGYFVVNYYRKSEKKWLLYTFSMVFGVNLIYNILLGLSMPEIFEEQESTELSISYGIIMNIADTSFISVGVWIIGLLLMVGFVSREKKNVVFYLILALPIIYYMFFQNTRATAILLFAIEIIGFIMAYFEPNNIKNVRAYYIMGSITLLILGLFLLVPIITFVLENVESDRLAQRLKDLMDFKVAGGNTKDLSEGSFSRRLLLAQTSMNSFLSTPLSIIIGIGDHTQSFGGDLIKSGIGGHSEFVDVLGKYGIIGAFVFYNILKYYYRLLKKLSEFRILRKYVNVIFFVIMMYGFLNLLFLPIILLFMYVIMPVIFQLADCKMNSENNTYMSRR